MALAIHVNGEARIRTGTGVANALETLGVSQDGVTIDFKSYQSDVKVDTFGGNEGAPFDVQHFLQEALISCDLVWYDDSVYAKTLRRLNDAGTAGVMGSAGSLFIQNSLSMRVLVMSIPTNQGVSGGEPCYNFPTAYPHDSLRNKFGTKHNLWNVTFRALPYLSSTTGGPSTGAVLWNSTAT